MAIGFASRKLKMRGELGRLAWVLAGRVATPRADQVAAFGNLEEFGGPPLIFIGFLETPPWCTLDSCVCPKTIFFL